MSHVKLSEINYKLLNVAKSGKTKKILYDNTPLQILTDSIYTPFGCKSFTNQYSKFIDWRLDVSMVESVNEDVYDTLQEKVKGLLNDNENVFSAILRENRSYPRLMTLKLPRDYKGNILSVFFDENGKKIQLNDNNVEDLLVRGKRYKVIIECKVWIYNGKTGLTWNIIQVRQITLTKESIENVKNDTIIQQNIMLDD